MNFEVELSGLSETQHSEFKIHYSLLVFPVSSTGSQALRAGGRAYMKHGSSCFVRRYWRLTIIRLRRNESKLRVKRIPNLVPIRVYPC